MGQVASVFFAVFISLTAFSGMADAKRAYVTPYGDYSRDCTIYGSCREAIPRREALKAIARYYSEKGYSIGTVVYRGRFIEVVVYKEDKMVDRVVFDRKTGRLRSVY